MAKANEELIEKIQMLRPIDDTFFEVLADDVEFCEEILQIILQDEKLKVLSVIVQKSVRNLVGRSVRVDALCQLGTGEKVNIEVQRSDKDHHLKRIRYNASCITASETEPGERFENVPTVIMVYISEFDFLKGNRTIYHIDNVVRETGAAIDNGLHIVCVNAKIDDGTDIAELMKCFMQTEVDNQKFPAVSKRMKYLKHSEGGLEKMCKIMEDYAKEYTKEYAKEVMQSHTDEQIKNALDKGKRPEDIADFIGVSLDRVNKVKDGKTILV